MASNKLAALTQATQAMRKELPDAVGYWIANNVHGDSRSDVFIFDENDDGELCWWHTGRPVMDFDKGEYYGPLKLVPVE